MSIHSPCCTFEICGSAGSFWGSAAVAAKRMDHHLVYATAFFSFDQTRANSGIHSFVYRNIPLSDQNFAVEVGFFISLAMLI